MVDMTAAEFLVFSILVLVAVGGFFVSREQAKSLPGLTAGLRKTR